MKFPTNVGLLPTTCGVGRVGAGAELFALEMDWIVHVGLGGDHVVSPNPRASIGV